MYTWEITLHGIRVEMELEIEKGYDMKQAIKEIEVLQDADLSQASEYEERPKGRERRNSGGYGGYGSYDDEYGDVSFD